MYTKIINYDIIDKIISKICIIIALKDSLNIKNYSILKKEIL